MRSRIHDDIQSLHGTMPLWVVNRWVPLGDLFVDVNILEQVSSSRRLELDDLWQDFIMGNSNYRSLDQIGLGKGQQRVSGLAVLERNTNLMVVGKPGSGKTTYLQRIVTECNDGKLQAQRIPVLIKLREFLEDGLEYAYNLTKFLGQLWRLSNADVELLLNQGRALVLLDGLDEVMGEAGKHIVKNIKQFARVYPQVQVVVTCRTQSQESWFERFDYVEVADFKEEQVKAFVVHWFGTVCADTGERQAQEFLEQLFQRGNKQIRDLIITPILLSLTCAVFHQTGKFYSQRSKLYQEGLELLLQQWDEKRGIERNEIYRDLLIERKLELLSYVALKKFEQQQYVLFEQEELEGYIGEFLGIELWESRMVLKAIECQHGLLIERSHKVWSFSHLTFQEYLVAKWFSNPNNHIKLAIHVTKKHWREVFILIFQLLNDANSLILEMKLIVDEFLSSTIELQKFLEWIHINTRESCIACKPSAIRAFYLQPELACIRNHNLTYAIDPKFSSKVKPGLYENVIYAFSQDFKFILLFNKDYNQFLIMDSYRENIVEQEFKILEKYIQYLYFENPMLEHISSRLNERNFWLKALQNFIIQYPNLGYHWNFNEIPKNLLRNYYDANLLIVDCLNINYKLSNIVRMKIEEELLLPISEINKLY
ncbi:NACHT domain-containing NTPase [Nostoc sp. FACHB-145]|uniref:NACHT domain-containing protein n=1 Tax=Nostoc sp. FACHB-145 TaxID=2692836 RepID=UPI001684FAA6|nr:NACHT domain-containing protein [Nostoc sp. FACHB-145]MBD2471707.1 NACHT domain-containing protein [Nostoc sp. FACHB-145]